MVGRKPQCGNGQPPVGSGSGRLPPTQSHSLARHTRITCVLCWYVCVGIRVSVGYGGGSQRLISASPRIFRLV